MVPEQKTQNRFVRLNPEAAPLISLIPYCSPIELSQPPSMHHIPASSPLLFFLYIHSIPKKAIFFSDFRLCLHLLPLSHASLVVTFAYPKKATWRLTSPTSSCLLGKRKGPYHPVWSSGWSITPSRLRRRKREITNKILSACLWVTSQVVPAIPTTHVFALPDTTSIRLE